MRVIGLKQSRDRIAGSRGRVKRFGALSQPRPYLNRVGARDRVQLATPLVQDEVDLHERLEPRPEAALRPARSLGYRTDASMIRRVKMQDAVCLSVTDRPQNQRLGLQRARHAILCEVMKPVILYTTDLCPYCRSAKALLEKRGVSYEEINLARDPDSRNTLAGITGMSTFPQIVIDGQSIGGFDQLLAADRAGRLPELLAA